MRGLAADLNVSKPAITRAVDKLGQLDLARRKVDPMDRRSVLVQQTVRDTMTIALDAGGDPRLTAWEEAFLVSVAESERIARTLSVKQKAVLEKIAEKISAPLPDLAEESDGVEGFC